LLEEVDIIKYLDTLKTEPIVAFDVETTGLDPFSPDTKLLSIAFATENIGISFPIDLKYKGMPLVNKSRILSQLNNLFQSKDTIFVGHNLKFDIKMLKSLGGINFTSNFMDTMIGGYILDETAVSNRLEAWLPIIGVENHKGFDFENEEYKRGSFESMDDIVNLLTYNAKDSLATLYLNNYLLDNIPEEQLDTMITLIKLTRALVDIELNGIRVDVAKLQGIQQQLESELEEIHTRLLINPDVIGAAKKLGVEPKDINFNSSKQIGVIFEVGGYPIIETTPTGAIATGTQVLQTLITKYDIPFVKDLAEYRKKAKILEGFIKPYLTGNIIKSDGRIHSTFHITGTVTGRLSSSDPNLQQIPRGNTVKQLFIPEEGHYLVNLDYSQAELRVMAMLAEDPKLLSAYRQDIDVHKLTAALVYNIPMEEVTKEQRQTAKMVNFAIIYGSSAKGLAYRLNRPEEEMKAFIDRWYEVYHNVKLFVANVSNFVKHYGYVVTPFGRRRHLPDVYSSNGALKARALRQANNFIIQSTASDLTLKSIIQIHDFLKAHKEYDAKILSTVHDSIVLSINKEQVIELLKVFKSFVESYNYTWMKGIRMKADYSIGTNYANQAELEELSEAALQKALTEVKEDDNIDEFTSFEEEINV
ncbi:MAG TPA: DNA polymerase, partial [Bacilli bacterium]|nr:DNA polymerase [Bacilli bacterium]